MTIDTVALLIDHIRELHGCSCEYVRTIRIRQIYKHRALWSGEVGIFTLSLLGEKVECYAWNTDGLDGTLSTPAVFLRMHDIKTPNAAVRAHILQYCQELAA